MKEPENICCHSPRKPAFCAVDMVFAQIDLFALKLPSCRKSFSSLQESQRWTGHTYRSNCLIYWCWDLSGREQGSNRSLYLQYRQSRAGQGRAVQQIRRESGTTRTTDLIGYPFIYSWQGWFMKLSSFVLLQNGAIGFMSWHHNFVLNHSVDPYAFPGHNLCTSLSVP